MFFTTFSWLVAILFNGTGLKIEQGWLDVCISPIGDIRIFNLLDHGYVAEICRRHVMHIIAAQSSCDVPVKMTFSEVQDL
jgi:hypothetical protein